MNNLLRKSGARAWLGLSTRFALLQTPAAAARSNSTLTILKGSNGYEIYLLGTAHISEESATNTRDLIQAVKPGTVFVELCEPRARALRSGQANTMSPDMKGDPMMQQMSEAVRKFAFANGKEMLVAMQEADKLGATVSLRCISHHFYTSSSRISSIRPCRHPVERNGLRISSGNAVA
jgi:hypothetical protein